MAELREELTELDARIASYDRKIRELYRNSEICQRLGKVEVDRPADGDSADRRGGRPKHLQERASVCGVAWPCS